MVFSSEAPISRVHTDLSFLWGRTVTDRATPTEVNKAHRPIDGSSSSHGFSTGRRKRFVCSISVLRPRVIAIATRIRVRVRAASTTTAGDRANTAVNSCDDGTLAALSAGDSNSHLKKEKS